MLYTDSSAFAKRYLAEWMREETVGFVASATVVAASLLAFTEVSSAIARAQRDRLILRVEGSLLLGQLDEDWRSVVALDVSFPVVRRAARFCQVHGLRAYDAVHLASALEWQDVIEQPVTFATFDRALHRAARDAGLVAWPERLEA